MVVAVVVTRWWWWWWADDSSSRGGGVCGGTDKRAARNGLGDLSSTDHVPSHLIGPRAGNRRGFETHRWVQTGGEGGRGGRGWPGGGRERRHTWGRVRPAPLDSIDPALSSASTATARSGPERNDPHGAARHATARRGAALFAGLSPCGALAARLQLRRPLGRGCLRAMPGCGQETSRCAVATPTRRLSGGYCGAAAGPK